MDAYKRIELIGGTEAMPNLVKKNQMVVRTVDKHSTGKRGVGGLGGPNCFRRRWQENQLNLWTTATFFFLMFACPFAFKGWEPPLDRENILNSNGLDNGT